MELPRKRSRTQRTVRPVAFISGSFSAGTSLTTLSTLSPKSPLPTPPPMPKRKSSNATILPTHQSATSAPRSASPSEASPHTLVTKSLVWLLVTIAIVPLFGIIHYNPLFTHLQYKFSGRLERSFPPVKVDRANCRNTCWDQGTAGIYYKTPGYYHVTYNMTPETLVFFTMYFVLFSMLQVTFYRIWDLFQKKRLDWLIVLCFLVNLPTFCYGIGVIATYINDRDNRMIGSQMPYTITEVIVSGALIWLMDTRLRIPLIMWVILTIDGSSLLKGAVDQVVNEPLTNAYALLRTLIFVSPDFVHILVILYRMSPLQRRDKRAWLIAGVIGAAWIFLQFFHVGSD